MDTKKELRIHNRRYIGSKTKLIDNIDNVVKEFYGNKKVKIADIFGGTGVVANHFAENGYDVIVNDFLYSNCVAYDTWISNEEFELKKIINAIEYYNSIDSHKLEENYFSEKFGNKYFDTNDAKKIGFIREDLEENKNKYTKREFDSILTSLMYETDKIANTCGHFESYLNKVPKEKGVIFQVPDIKLKNQKTEIYCMDSNELVKNIYADVFYIDPPYNARQYVNFYHVLENLVRWEKPQELEGRSMKFKRNHLKSKYSRPEAPEVFEDLIENIKGELIIVSYNNTYNAKSTSSNNKITEEQMVKILSNKGKIKRVDIGYKSFNAGKTDLKNHKEYLYVCEVKK